MAVRDRWRDIRERLATETPVIVDGGAHTGATLQLLLQHYRAPTIHAFEPVPGLANDLRARFAGDPRVNVYAQALGAEDRWVPFHVLNYAPSSSLYTPAAWAKKYHGAKMDIRETIEVQQVRLETVLRGEIDLLKLDLQGYELEALKGCGRLLGRIPVITTEVEFVPLYSGQPLFGEVDQFLRNHGFELLNLYELWTQPDGQLTAGDAVYLNRAHRSRGEADGE